MAFKINQLAKDMGLKSKDLTGILAEKGVEVPTPQKPLKGEEFDMLFEALTKDHQISGIDDYLDGTTYIPVAESAKPASKTASAQKTTAKPTAAEPKTAATAAKTPAPAATAETKTPAAPAPKAEPAVKTPAPAATAETKTPAAPAPKAEPAAKTPVTAATAETKTPAAPAPKAEPAVKTPVTAATAETKTPAAPAAETPRTTTDNHVGATAANRPANHTPTPNHPPVGSNGLRPNTNRYTGPNSRPIGSNGFRQNTNVAAHPSSSSTSTAPRPQGSSFGNGSTAPRTGSYGNNNNSGSYGNNNGGSYGNNGSGTSRPPYGSSTSAPRPAGSGFSSPRPAGGGFSSPRPAGGGFRPQGGGGRPTGGGRPNNNRFGGGHGNDKDRDYQPSAPKEKFQPTVIVRGQTPKGTADPKAPKEVRIVDTRTTSVDLSKYDEHLDTFVPDADKITPAVGTPQKVRHTQQPSTRTQIYNNNRRNRRGGFRGQKSTVPVTKAPTNVTIPAEVSVGSLASILKVTAAEVIKRLIGLGMMATVNQVIDYDTAALVADELGIHATQEVVVTIEEKLFDGDNEEDAEEDLITRAPVVCVMGHVDHGKTSLLDAIRHTNVTAGEAGGITQSIGAYRVKAKGKDLTFLDTPGHEAFTAMRARGAMATDIAVLVVAADDGIMPQTVEAIHHAKAAGIDIIVAINKMDKPGANPENIKQELTKYELVPEEWGGDVMCVPVSAVTKEGIDTLLEDILLIAEMKELKANPNRRAKGIVIESRLDKGRGPVATILVQTGTLQNGDIVIAGTSVGRIRAMNDHNGRLIKSAGPSVPVEITGLSEVPLSGDQFNVVADEKMARELADQRRSSAKEEVFKANARASLDDLFTQISDGVKTLNIIVKADVVGSAEAVKQSLLKISNEEVRVSVIHSAAGSITENDVMFAAASNAIIVGFNVRPDKAAIDSAERQSVEIRTYRIIYECIEEITAAMKGMLAPKYKETILGHAEVRQVIKVSSVGTIAGSYITDGKINRASQIRVLRDGVVVFEDKIASLRRFKEDVKDVAEGYECGVGLEKFNDIRVGDMLESYIMEEIPQ